MVRFDPLSRREAVRRLAAGTIGAAAGASWVDSLVALAQTHAHTQAAATAAQTADWKPRVLSPPQNELVVTLTELIIPQTDTPGARAVGVNRFIDEVLREAEAGHREKFLRGLAWIDERSRTLFGSDFVGAAPDKQIELLTRLADDTRQAGEDRPGVEFFQAVKSMTISGYYTTQVGLQQELGDDGRVAMAEFEGCTHPEHIEK